MDERAAGTLCGAKMNMYEKYAATKTRRAPTSADALRSPAGGGSARCTHHSIPF